METLKCKTNSIQGGFSNDDKIDNPSEMKQN